MDPMMGASQSLDQEQDPSNLKNILADIGPPEFIPGKKWAGFRPIDPENDPDITPGSVASAKAMSVNTVKDIDQVRDWTVLCWESLSVRLPGLKVFALCRLSELGFRSDFQPISR